MLSITKLQNLKAIHNILASANVYFFDVINHKTTKFESNSQQVYCPNTDTLKMLSITKLQNLKAIHNTLGTIKKQVYDVINHKTTKFESNSQHAQVKKAFEARCYQS